MPRFGRVFQGKSPPVLCELTDVEHEKDGGHSASYDVEQPPIPAIYIIMYLSLIHI